MKITLKQYGGLAGRRVAVVLDTAALAGERDALEGLARTVASEPDSSSAPHPDEMGYTLVIADGGVLREARAADSSATPAFSRLVQEVKTRGTAEAV